jgi:endonuclease YncB( thermonuclease family)
MDGRGTTKKYSTDAKLAELEKSARIARAGLWADSKPKEENGNLVITG